jgi:NAD-specific glutamate dehydrogenase
MRPAEGSIDEEIERASADFARLSEGMPHVGGPRWREPYERVAAEMRERGIPDHLATRHAYQRVLRRAPDMVDLAHLYHRDVLDIAEIYTRSSEEFYIGWLERQIRNLPGMTAFDRLAIESLRDDLQALRRDVVATILSETDGSIDDYTELHDRVIPRIERWYRWLTRDGILDVSAGLIATRRLRKILIG